MGESFDERLANLKSILTNYNNVDQQYIADKLSDFININYKDVDFSLTYRDIMTDGQLKNYLNDKVYSSTLRAITDLKENAFCGEKIRKELIPKEYIQKYNIDNLYWYPLPNGWRLIYSLATPDKVRILAVILEYFNHKNYERKFGY